MTEKDPAKERGSDGFSLIELSLVLIIMGILMTSGLSWMTSYYRIARIRITQENQEIVMKALQNHMMRYACLPCPSSSENKGVARASCGDMSCVGAIPFLTLGLPKRVAKDGFGHVIMYAVDPNLTVPLSGKKKKSRHQLCTRAYAKPPRIDVCNKETQSVNAHMKNNEGVAFVLVSYGPSSRHLHNNSLLFYEEALPGDTSFQDIVTWRTKGLLLIEAGISCADTFLPSFFPFGPRRVYP